MCLLLDLEAWASRDAWRVSSWEPPSPSSGGIVQGWAVSARLPPCGVPAEALGQVEAGGLELVADEAQPEEPAAEGVLRVVGDRAGRAGGLRCQGLEGNGHAELDVGFDFPGVECAVEGPEFDGVCRALGGKGRVEVEAVMFIST